MYSFIALSIILHVILFSSLKLRDHKPLDKKSLKSTVKIVFKKKSTPKPAQSALKKGIWKSFNMGELNTNRLVGQSKVSDSNQRGVDAVSLKIHELIEPRVVYPSFISKLGIQGFVICKIYINEKGVYIESLSQVESSNKFLEIYIRRILRQALEKGLDQYIKKNGFYSINFHFHLATRPREIENTNLNFYVWKRGGDRGVDQLSNGLSEALGSVANILSLLKYLPNVKESEKKRIQKEIEILKRDEYW